MIPSSSPLSMFTHAFVTQAAAHFAIAGALFLLVCRWGKERFRDRRVQPRSRIDARQLRREALYTLSTLAIGTAIAVGVSMLYASGATKVTSDPSTLGWAWSIVSLLGFIVFNDAWFYAWHRVLHHPKLFRYVHRVHHESVDVNPFTVYSFHPAEAFLLGSAVVPFVLCIPTYLPLLGVAQVIGLANNLMSHLGYELLPRWYNRVVPFRYLNTATFHGLHHASYRGNYGLLFRVWDRAFGTELPEYEATFLARTAVTTGDRVDGRSPHPRIGRHG